MIVVGGVYREECVVPHWSTIFGSGGRAACVLGARGTEVSLHGYAHNGWIDDALASFRASGVSAQLQPIPDDIAFHYFHTLSGAQAVGVPKTRHEPLVVRGEAVLRFGFVEGDAIVQAERCVFDPQGAGDALRFGNNGSKSKALAIVLNEAELQASTGLQGPEAVAAARESTGAEVVVVKRGPWGAEVHAHGPAQLVPARLSPEVFKIGSGDVFSAVFAEGWAGKGMDPERAAQEASEAVARYVASRDVGSVPAGVEPFPLAPTGGQKGPIYIAAPFFNLGQRWVVEELCVALTGLGATIFSPLHEVGTIGDATTVANADLEGLRACGSVLAVVDREDAGTLFEVGYARARGIPVVALAEAPRREALTMLEGSGCRITRDVASAAYHAIWAALE